MMDVPNENEKYGLSKVVRGPHHGNQALPKRPALQPNDHPHTTCLVAPQLSQSAGSLPYPIQNMMKDILGR